MNGRMRMYTQVERNRYPQLKKKKRWFQIHSTMLRNSWGGRRGLPEVGRNINYQTMWCTYGEYPLSGMCVFSQPWDYEQKTLKK